MLYERPRVAVLTDHFLHPAHDAFLPTAENLSLLALARFIRAEMGWEAEIHQMSPHRERFFGGLRVLGIDAGCDRNGMYPEVNFAFARRGLEYDLRIYYHWHLAFPQVAHGSIVVSQGIFWDTPAGVMNRTNPVGREEWSRRLLYALAAPAAFVAQDRNTINVIKATWPGYEHRLVYLPPGVDLESFRPADPRPEGETIRVACPQDFLLEQGLSEIFSLCEAVAAREPRLEFHLLGRPAEFRTAAALAARARALPNCRFHWAPTALLPALYRSFHLALLPYRAAAGASLHCLQAMAAGLPVVAGLAGGLAEMVVDGWNGFLVHPCAAGALGEAVLALAADPALRLRMGGNARRLAGGYPERRWKERWRMLLLRVLEGGDPGLEGDGSWDSPGPAGESGG